MRSCAISSSFLPLVLSLVTVWGNVPSGFRLDVRPECGSDGKEDAMITVVTDMTLINATAPCRNGTEYFTSTDSVHFNLPVSYPSHGDSQCVFKQRNGGVYYLVISIAYGQTDLETQFRSLSYIVTCSFSARSDNITEGHEVSNGLIAPQQLVNVVGPDSGASLTLTILDVLGNDITGTNITMGRTIQIKLEANNTVGSGIYPVSCYGSNGVKKYDVLRAGCGDGAIFPKNIGFFTTGNVSYSPYFQVFGFGDSSVFAVECIVAQCPSGCDGSSCNIARRTRRGAADDGNYGYYLTATSTKTLIDPKPFHPTNDQQSDDNSKSVENPSKNENEISGVMPKVKFPPKSSPGASESVDNGYDVFGSVTHHQVKGSPRQVLKPAQQDADESILEDPVWGGEVYQGIIGKPRDAIPVEVHDQTSTQMNTKPQNSEAQKDDLTTEAQDHRQYDTSIHSAFKNKTIHSKLHQELLRSTQKPQSERNNNRNVSNKPLHKSEFPNARVLHVQSKFLGLIQPDDANNRQSSKPSHEDGQQSKQVNDSKHGTRKSNIKPYKANDSMNTQQEILRRPGNLAAIGIARSPVTYVLPKGKESAPKKPNGTLPDVFLTKEKLPGHKNTEEHVLSKPVAMYVVGIIIVALFSLANIALAFSLCRRQD